MAERDMGPLDVQTLGRFIVWRAGERLADDVWSREKALTLFHYFITHPEVVMSKERIAEDLWPDLDPEQADRDFKVAMNALNDALEPERPSRSNAIYLVRQGSSYGLNPESTIMLDYVQFEEALVKASQQDEAQAATRCYRKALELYNGDYLPDQLLSDWTAATREKLSSLYMTGATKLAALLVAQAEHIEAILWCQRVLELDPCWEEACRLLMKSYQAQGNRPKAVRCYHQLEAALKEELELEPMAETRKLYASILEG